MRAGPTAGHRVTSSWISGGQPACDYSPRSGDPGPDPVYPLQMWLHSSCGLGQLPTDPTMLEEPRGTEPAALAAPGRRRRGTGERAGLLQKRA